MTPSRWPTARSARKRLSRVWLCAAPAAPFWTARKPRSTASCLVKPVNRVKPVKNDRPQRLGGPERSRKKTQQGSANRNPQRSSSAPSEASTSIPGRSGEYCQFHSSRVRPKEKGGSFEPPKTWARLTNQTQSYHKLATGKPALSGP